jgi:DNA repair exonuclease SbcCD ATPase subunit
MIYSVKMKNFKQHLDYEAVFNDGLNTVQGENGSGKTTVLKAILFSLFGATAVGSKDHLTTWGQTKMSVETDLLLPVGCVKITRSFAKAEIKLGDELLASGQTAVTNYVEAQLGMNAKLFKSMLFAEQGEAQLLLKMGAAGLQRQLETVANIEVIDKVIALISLDNVRAEGELLGIGELKDINALRERLAEVERDVRSRTSTHQQLMTEVEIKTVLNNSFKGLYEKAVSDSLLYTKLSAELASQVARYDLLKQQQEKLQANKPEQPCPQTLVDQQDELITLQKSIELDRSLLRDYHQALHTYEVAVKRQDALELLQPIITQAKALNEVAVQKRELMQQAVTHVKVAKEAVNSINCLAAYSGPT